MNEKMKKTARPVSESSAFDGRVVLGLDGLGLVPVSQRHVASGSRAGVWLIVCEIEDGVVPVLHGLRGGRAHTLVMAGRRV
ncbi:hypothetical protein [Bifidobacterium longum]|uniref:hypothetical protein n=1 Tax=Bifidobacterium longum TaxID=216816 RepID=UPI0019D38676|nr:hypothetical protein [Bifidobacterium longum]